MKRISSCLVLLAFMPSIVEAHCYSVSACCQIRYSPYALSYRHSGLVPGGLDYSLHAFGYNRSALVYGNVRYTPWALKYYNSGLVADYCSYAAPSYGYPYPVYSGYYTPAYARPCDRSQTIAPGRISNPRPAYQPAVAKKPDGMDIIRQRLRDKGIGAANINRILRVDNELISVDFLLKDRNLLIKYWNPQEIERLSAKEPFKQKLYEKYRQDWERFAGQYKQAGGDIYYVNASDSQAVAAALDSCTKLDAGRNVTSQPVLYAKR
ncbi:MAG: hypothetical protein A2Y77_12715 [Planctomycetes bacterium RBG_13_62_9]|nr:MAG: hypothetical protein A2Y77_12715 [Planctomycetes bacterium RBG_13_62_9]